MEPSHYLRASYFERWRTSIEKNLLDAGALTRTELEERVRALRESPSGAGGEPRRIAPAPPPPRPPQPGFEREVAMSPRYAVGDAVRGRNLHPSGHTRLPRYARAKRGRVARVYPAFVFPDTNAHGQGENPQYLYNVRFDGRELWGDASEPGVSVSLDLFESYLEPDA
jgi:nitrile hydratase